MLRVTRDFAFTAFHSIGNPITVIGLQMTWQTIIRLNFFSSRQRNVHVRVVCRKMLVHIPCCSLPPSDPDKRGVIWFSSVANSGFGCLTCRRFIPKRSRMQMTGPFDAVFQNEMLVKYQQFIGDGCANCV